MTEDIAADEMEEICRDATKSKDDLLIEPDFCFDKKNLFLTVLRRNPISESKRHYLTTLDPVVKEKIDEIFQKAKKATDDGEEAVVHFNCCFFSEDSSQYLVEVMRKHTSRKFEYRFSFSVFETLDFHNTELGRIKFIASIFLKK